MMADKAVASKTEIKRDAEQSTAPERMDYDNLFKTALRRYFLEALKILVIELYEAADRRVGPVFLEQELQKITFDLGEGTNRTDLLVRIKLKNGCDELILSHLEIQGEGGGNMTVRMYRYKEMIHLRYGEEPIGVAVTTAPRPRGEKTFYSWKRFGVKVAYEYLNVPVIELDDAVLLARESRAGLIFYAAKCMWESGDDERKKFQYLRKITSLWVERGWDRDDKRIILLAANYLLNLKDENYAKQYVEHMESLKMNEEDQEMYVSVFERVYTARGEEKGRKEGFGEGFGEGLGEGLKKGRVEIAKNMLNKGFSAKEILECIDMPSEELATLMDGF